MLVRLLHVTDTHLGIDRFYRGAPVDWRRADDHVAAFEAAVAPAMRGEVDVVVHSGDLFDRSSPPPAAVATAATLLAELARRVRVLLMPGNHDAQGLARFFPEGIPGVSIFDRPGTADVDDVRIGLVPYHREAGAWAAGAPECDVLVAHQSFHGVRVPGYTFRVGAGADVVGEEHLPSARWVLCGHIHPRQIVRLGHARVVHPGSTERTAFAEAGETKGHALWAFEREVDWRFVDLPTRRMLIVRAAPDLDGVTPGTLVRLDGPARAPEVEAEVLRRGGWVAPWKRDTGQARLFG